MPLLFWYPIIIWSALYECAIMQNRFTIEETLVSDARKERHSGALRRGQSVK